MYVTFFRKERNEKYKDDPKKFGKDSKKKDKEKD